MAQSDPLSITNWGPDGWLFLHSCSFAYPEAPTTRDQEHARKFYENVGAMLPCEKCRRHYAQHLQADPVSNHVHSREALTRWVVSVHNKVNESCGKATVPYDRVCEWYRDPSQTRVQACSINDLVSTPRRAWGLVGLIMACAIGACVAVLVWKRR